MTDMKKWWLINPPIRLTDLPRHIPYGLAQLAAVLDESGYDVGLLDVNAHRLDDEVVVAECEDQGDLLAIGIGGLVTTYKWVKRILPRLRTASNAQEAHIVVGGGLASSIGFPLLQWNPEVDILALGEGEKTVIELTEALQEVDGERNRERDQMLDNVDGIIYRSWNDSRRFKATPPRTLLTPKELNELPYPLIRILPMDVYFRNSPLALSAPAMNAQRRIDVISERGCPMKCTFCFHNLMGSGRVRFQSPRYVVDMVKHWRLLFQIDFVSFLDENMTCNAKRTHELCNLWEKEGLSEIIRWGCLGRVPDADLTLLDRMFRTGCTYISYGGESASQRVLDGMQKKHTPAQMQGALQATAQTGINPVMTFMIGMPNEKATDIIKTVRFWKRNSILTVPFFPTPYPKTQLFEENKAKILAQMDGDTEDEKYENFILQLDDATKFVANLSPYDDVTFLGLYSLACMQDLKRLRKWRDEHEYDEKDLEEEDDLEEILEAKKQAANSIQKGRAAFFRKT